MKYIRTKSFITKFEDWMEINGSLLSIGAIKYIIVDQADTIEEVCDMFVVWLEGRNMPIEMPLSEKEQYEKMKEVVLLGTKEKLNIWLKLAIWTDQGLIYVAKMNEKGELELI